MIYMYSVPLLAQLNDKVFNSLKAIFSFPALRSISVTGSDQFRHDMSFELMGIVESKDAQSLERAYFSLLNSRHSGFSPTTYPLRRQNSLICPQSCLTRLINELGDDYL